MLKIVVLGGSFNPPTRAHKVLLRTSVDRVQADLGIFVPSSNYYVARKIQRTPNSKAMFLTEERRNKILRLMCNGDAKLSISTCEFGDKTSGRTLKTLREIKETYQKQDKDCEVYNIMGADKIKDFEKWPSAVRILSDFHTIWVGRDEQTTQYLVEHSKLLREHKDKIHFMDEIPELSGISSSAFWRLIDSNDYEAAYNMLDPRTVDYMKYLLENLRAEREQSRTK